MKMNNLSGCSILFTVLSLAIYTSCQPDEFGNGNGLVSPELAPDFTMSTIEVPGKANTYKFRVNNMSNVLGVKWDLGDGNLVAGLEETDTVFYPDADTYPIRLTLIGIGGREFSTSKDLVIGTPDPNAGNLLRGGKLNDGDDQYWSIVQYSGSVSPVFENGKVIFNYKDWSHAGIYQQVEIPAAGSYRIDMSVSGKGATDTWFEVYLGTTVPQSGGGMDYNDGGNRLALNTWAGCGKSAFNDKLTKLACAGSASGSANGVITVDNAGTYYLVIRTGGANLGDGGIAVDNIELRPAN
jgi:hypothetical protein